MTSMPSYMAESLEKLQKLGQRLHLPHLVQLYEFTGVWTMEQVALLPPSLTKLDLLVQLSDYESDEFDATLLPPLLTQLDLQF